SASKDGPSMICEQSCGAQCNSAPDVWYKWVSGPILSQTTFTMCYPQSGYIEDPNLPVDQLNLDPAYPVSLLTYDAIMLIYTDCPASGGVNVTGACNDDGCNRSGAANVSKVITQNVNPNSTYWVRISGWSGKKGQFTVRVNQP